MRLMTVDIGNSSSRIVLEDRCDRNPVWLAVVRGDSHPDDELGRFKFPDEPLFWAVSSVNQNRLDQLSAWVVGNRPDDRFHVISPDDVPLASDVESRSMLGRDRLIAAWMAVELNGQSGPVVVVDAGTAVTIDRVDERPIFQGGFIFPGADLNFSQLAGNTSALPQLGYHQRIKLLTSVEPGHPVSKSETIDFRLGKSTIEAILQGIYQAQVEGISGIVNRLISNSNEPTNVYLTGGGISEIMEVSHALPTTFPESWNHVPDLVLHGASAIGHLILARQEQ